MRDVGAPLTLARARATREDDIPALAEGAHKQQRLLVVAPRDAGLPGARGDPARLAVSAGGQAATPLADAVDAFLADPGIAPFTTPGHKRAPELADPLLALDLPLSAGADDLHLSLGVLARAEELAAELWGADLCRFCVNGSTQGNQALCLAAGRPGDAVVVSRNLHKSLFAGLVLAGLEPVWVRPDVDPETGLALGVPSERIAAVMRERDDVRAVLLVEPNFVGVMSDVARIATAAHGGRGRRDRRPGLGRLPRLPSAACRRTPSASAPTRWSRRRTRR